jgi:hypothetical protein
MRLASGLATILSITLLVLPPAPAEEPSSAAPGDQPVPGRLYRVTAPTHSPTPIVGMFAEQRSGEWVFVGSEIGTRTVPVSAVTKLEWSSGQRSMAREFALGGVLLGAAVGAVGGATAGGDCKGQAGSCAGLGALVGGIGWGAVGALLGLAVKTYAWSEVPLPQGHRGPQVSVAPLAVRGSGAGVAVAVRW